MTSYSVEAVIHLAGLKAVGESVAEPLCYYDSNVAGSLNLLRAMDQCGIKTLVFSSSATVYGDPQYLPIDEAHPVSATNPYGRTKLMVELILEDLAASDPSWRIAALRYFNPVGAHESGLIGEDPQGTPNNLMPYISRVAAGQLAELGIFGDDYETSDGTGVRDYIHVCDLADGHVAALEAIASSEPTHSVWNLGTGQGTSVLEMVSAFQQANAVSVPCTIRPRRPGDIASSYASADKAKRELGWIAKHDLIAMCRSSWRFEKGLSALQNCQTLRNASETFAIC